jgi:hypothetical protein
MTPYHFHFRLGLDILTGVWWVRSQIFRQFLGFGILLNFPPILPGDQENSPAPTRNRKFSPKISKFPTNILKCQNRRELPKNLEN